MANMKNPRTKKKDQQSKNERKTQYTVPTIYPDIEFVNRTDP